MKAVVRLHKHFEILPKSFCFVQVCNNFLALSYTGFLAQRRIYPVTYYRENRRGIIGPGSVYRD